MAGPIVHKHFLHECLANVNVDATKNNNLNVYAQGHDLLLYIEFWNFVKNRNLSLILSNFNFREFVYNYLANAYKDDNVFQNTELKMFLYGYISHHILDSYFHPFIMQYTDDYLPVAGKPWLHGKIETLYDTKFIVEKEKKSVQEYKIYRDFKYINSYNLTNTIDKTILDTYNISNRGKKFSKAFKHIERYMYLYRYDPYKLKKRFAEITESIVKLGASDFFYDESKLNELKQYMNTNSEMWINKFTGQASFANFTEIYYKALQETINIIGNIEDMIISGKLLSKNQLDGIIPNISAITGAECNRHLSYIKYRGN